ncbi:hypothetical protein BDN72DRAFT_765610 [Pluteus cervinus]|uniref:Uncharacterized protein n=1 Tax=Pluteus cervinus TaxID=181527 RepID=A0ACD3B0E5_9AGAR|nr:hypothetical protein BDN72DRAFT_765610 [Pluteus cervinus]
MPKKDKVVDTEDDARYMTIYQPFPFGGNWELESDYIQLLYWLACCTGKDALFAVLHRPKVRSKFYLRLSSASMVIIEVDKDFPDFNVLLGEHRWNQFLRNPTEDEAGRTSKIYYSTYSTSMEAKKDGWKRIHVESCFFDKWAPVNRLVAHPYPKSGYCDVPPENVTTKRLCRPLPMTFQPRPGLQHTKAPANQKPVRQGKRSKECHAPITVTDDVLYSSRCIMGR